MPLNVSFSLLPSKVAPVMMATPIRVAIRPYSMAVTPDWSFANRVTSFFIWFPRQDVLRRRPRPSQPDVGHKGYGQSSAQRLMRPIECNSIGNPTAGAPVDRQRPERPEGQNCG